MTFGDMTTQDPLVSVIMPTYNHGAFLADAISSVLVQTHSRLELIVVDNFSADNTHDVVASFSDPRVRYFQFDNHGVIAAGRNFGVSQANGEALAFLDSDDSWLPDKLQLQLPHLSDTRISCVGSNFEATGETRYFKQHLSFRDGREYRDFTYDEIAGFNPVMTSSSLLRRSDFLAAGRFDECRDFRFIEDWELWLRMARKGVVRVLSQPLIRYRVVRRKGRDTRAVSLGALAVLDKHRKMGWLSDNVLSAALGYCYLAIGKAHLDSNDRQGLQYYQLGLRHAAGLRSKLRALGGLVLFHTPRRIRELMLECYYRIPVGTRP